MRFMTGNRLRNHVPIKKFLEKTTLTPFTPIIKNKVLKLYGHVKRSKNGLSKIYLEGMVEGKRNRGRPRIFGQI